VTDRLEIVEAMRRVVDPEIGMNIVDLGLVYAVEWDEEEGHVYVEMTLTTPGCPFGPELINAIRRELGSFDDVLSVDVELVWRPLWHPSMMSDYAKDELGYDEELGLGLGYSWG
jgi:metal-sulfur cluster biosynthetic enzyme